MRESGILMHISSLPGPCGIGTMGSAAYHFVDFLEQAGQSCWQILPLTPTGYGDSPYQSFCSSAGNPYLIDLDLLVKQGLLKPEELQKIDWGNNPRRVDFGIQFQNRLAVLDLAYSRFVPDEKFQAFISENQEWLEDYALFMALKEEYEGKSWLEWPEPVRLRDPDALAEKRKSLSGQIQQHFFQQYVFSCQWKALRRYANEKGIRIIGDVPIYVPLDSADVWANPTLFQLDEQRRPKLVAGCPPDAFSADGQLWGNPLFDWQAMADTGYRWWIRRLKVAAGLYDVVRLDHFRGFESYWAIPAGEDTAKNGAWLKGPGMNFLRAIRKALPDLDFIAEDLGYVTDQVRQMQLEFGYPGMKVMEFAFDSREAGNYLPHLYPVESVVYTGTHDNVTLKQWFDEAAPEDIAYAKAYLGLNSEEGYTWGMIRGAMSSVSRLCMVQMQDYLELGKEGRMNYPGTLSSDNWTWRAPDGFDSLALAEKIQAMTRLYGRLATCPAKSPSGN